MFLSAVGFELPLFAPEKRRSVISACAVALDNITLVVSRVAARHFLVCIPNPFSYAVLKLGRISPGQGRTIVPVCRFVRLTKRLEIHRHCP